MNTNVYFALFEAYRRNEMADSFERGKPLLKRWLGLGTEAFYRPTLAAGLMRWHDGQAPPKRCMGWLCLTENGAAEMQKHSAEFEARLSRMREQGYDRTIMAHYQLAGGISRR